MSPGRVPKLDKKERVWDQRLMAMLNTRIARLESTPLFL